MAVHTDIEDVRLICPRRHADDRGFLSETYKKSTFKELGVEGDFVQDNHSCSARRGTLRGLHFQIPPFAQDKLIRVVNGAILDVAVDIRRGSPTFGRYVRAHVSRSNWKQILVPAGFAHGFVTLEPDTEVIYKLTSEFAPEYERGLRWNDPDIGIDWEMDEQSILLSDKDRAHPLLAELPEYFKYEG